jgi:cytochrome c oxidase cbb3-type subunit III
MKTLTKYFLPIIAIFAVATANAQSNSQPENAPIASTLNNPLALTMVIIAAALAIIIAILSNVVGGTAEWFRNKQKQNTSIVIGLLFFTPFSSFAQENNIAATTVVSNTIGGMSSPVFYVLCSVIAVEMFAILMQLYFIKLFLAKEAIAKVAESKKPLAWANWWNKINSFKAFDKEVEIDLGHNYDGIRELDNSLPKWWLYGFYLTIFVGVVYLYRFHYAHTAPSSKEEFEIAIKHAEEEKEKYLAKAANNVDENTVTLLTDIAAIEKGKTNFTTMCAACHGTEGQGGVGPNLTDNYWLNGGSINDIFKTIKYGKPEKGMRSWKDDFSPIQIAQIASYIKNMQGTKPANAKEKQGELFIENNNNKADSSTNKSVAIK